ncbi:MAG: AarF/ABC1/UbiB kinase family protein [Firmicutes bacterium]|nr:AarF/ABC1/UbiB kinase family protein [Bacillota bacterium]
MGIRKSVRHLLRYREITHVFVKHGLGYVAQRIGLAKGLSEKECVKEPDCYLAGRLHSAITELGPTFVKLGQVLSTRPDLMPPDYIAELERLQDKVPPFPYQQVVKQLVKEIGHPEEIFEEFDPTPLAAASIGQVHLARLKTGEKVIVKVQRPDIEKQIDNDLEILVGLAKMAEKRSDLARQIGLEAMIEDFAKLFRRELDYDRESKNTERMRINFQNDERVIIPRVFWEYTTPRVLTEEYIEGIKFSDIAEVERRGLDRRKLSALGTEAFLSQILEHGFFQVDPHPGNILIIDDDHIAFIDFGEVAVLSGRRLETLAELFTNLNSRDLDGLMSTMRDLGFVTESIDADQFQDDLSDVIERVYMGSIGNIDIKQLQGDLLDLAYRYQMKVPSYMTSLMKALIIVEGVGRKLDPTFNFTEVAVDLGKRLFIERLKPKNLFNSLKRNYHRDVRPLLAFPRHFNNLVRHTSDGHLKVNIQVSLTEKAESQVFRLVNRLCASVLVTGGLVGAALILRNDIRSLELHGPLVVAVVVSFLAIGLFSLGASFRRK